MYSSMELAVDRFAIMYTCLPIVFQYQRGARRGEPKS